MLRTEVTAAEATHGDRRILSDITPLLIVNKHLLLFCFFFFEFPLKFRYLSFLGASPVVPEKTWSRFASFIIDDCRLSSFPSESLPGNDREVVGQVGSFVWIDLERSTER